MSQENSLSASLEDYLEAIFTIISEKGGVRVKDISSQLSVKAGSVTTALQSLTKTGYINYKPYGIITLTSKGVEQAKKVLRKHEILQRFFTEVLGAEIKESQEVACKIEHVITENLLDRLVPFTEFVKSCPQCGSDIIRQFHTFYKELSLPLSEKEQSVERVLEEGKNFCPQC